jgi:HAE1 family hydrophobic/amphiphilic exporter-1
LVVSQLLTLYITPVFYIYMEKLRSKFDRKEKKPKKTPRVKPPVTPEPVRETITGD